MSLKFEFNASGRRRFAYYNSGKACFYKDNILLWEFNWYNDYTHMNLFESNGEIFLFSYRVGLLQAFGVIDKLTDASNIELKRHGNWAKDWSQFEILSKFETFHGPILKSTKYVGGTKITAYDLIDTTTGELTSIKRIEEYM